MSVRHSEPYPFVTVRPVCPWCGTDQPVATMAYMDDSNVISGRSYSDAYRDNCVACGKRMRVKVSITRVRQEN